MFLNPFTPILILILILVLTVSPTLTLTLTLPSALLLHLERQMGLESSPWGPYIESLPSFTPNSLNLNPEVQKKIPLLPHRNTNFRVDNVKLLLLLVHVDTNPDPGPRPRR